MILGLLAGVLLPVAASTALIRLAAPDLWGRSRTLILSLAVIVGLGASSLLFALTIFAAGPRRSFYIPIEIALWVLVCFVSLFTFRAAPAGSARQRALSPIELGSVLLFAGAVAVSSVHFYLVSANHPSGSWDAQAIWALKARFLHRGLDGHWREVFQPAFLYSHPDYPLMLSASTARLWSYAQSETRLAPIVLAALFASATVGMVLGALLALGRRPEAFCAGALVLVSLDFNLWSAGQMADVPLAAFVLASTILLSWIVEHGPERSGGAVAILVLSAGCAAWTKNEGVVFAGATCVALGATVALFQRGKLGEGHWGGLWTLLLAAAGLLLPAAALIYFKGSIAPPNYLFQPDPASSPSSKLLNPTRHLEILRAFAHQFWAWNTPRPIGMIPFIAAYTLAASLLCGLRRRQLVVGFPLVVMLLGYYGAYVLTPHDLKWHIQFSVTRLLVHIWPAAVYLCFTLAESTTPLRGERETANA